MRDTASLTKRPHRQFTKSHKASGALRAGTLGDIQNKKTKFEDHFIKPWSKHEHSWIPGTDIEVCTKCGTSRPKIIS